MAGEMLPFERITRTLPNLNKDDLPNLLKAVDDLLAQVSSDPASKSQISQAEGTFFEASDQHATLDEILQLIKGLNPAELRILSHLIPYYLDGMRHSNGERFAVTLNRPWPGSVSFMGTAPNRVSQDDMQQRVELFKSIPSLSNLAKEAKAGGDQQRASALFEQATNLMKERGFSEYELRKLRDLFPQ